MQVFYKHTLMDRILTEVQKAESKCKEIAYITLSTAQAEKLHEELRRGSYVDVGQFIPRLETFLDRLSGHRGSANVFTIYGVRLCLHGSSAHAHLEAQR